MQNRSYYSRTFPGYIFHPTTTTPLGANHGVVRGELFRTSDTNILMVW